MNLAFNFLDYVIIPINQQTVNRPSVLIEAIYYEGNFVVS